MLRQLRNEKVMKSIMIGVIAVVVPSFVVFYGWESSCSQNGLPVDVAATLKFGMFDKVKVETADMPEARNVLRQRVNAYMQQNNLRPDPQTIERIVSSDAIVREAVNIALLRQFAKTHGIAVSQTEVEDTIAQFPPQYKQAVLSQLASEGKSIEQFAQDLESSLLMGKVRQALAAQTRVSYYEAWLNFVEKNQKLKLDYVRFDSTDYESKVNIDEKELAAYFEKNKEKFRVPDRLKYAYVMLTKDDLRSSVTVTNDEITSYYNSHQEEYRLPDAAHVRHIFLAKPQVDPGTSTTEEITSMTQEIATRATDIYQRAAKGEDFASLATKYGEEKVFPPREEDKATTATDKGTTAGGDLGTILEPTAKTFYGDDWSSAVFHMSPGAISPPIETPRGFSIPKLESLKKGAVQPLDKVQNVIKQQLVDEKVTPLFEQQGAKLRDVLPKSTTLERIAEATSLTVHQTDWVNRDAKFIPGLGRLGEFEEAIRDLPKGNLSEVLTDQYKHFVIQIREEDPEHIPTLAEARSKVEQAFKHDKALEMASADAEKLKAKSVNPDAMKTAAKDMGVTVTESRPFLVSEVSAIVGPIVNFDTAAQQVQKGSVELSKLGTETEALGYVVWAVADKTLPTQEEFAKEIPKLLTEISERKAEIVIQEYLRDQWNKLDKNIKIDPQYVSQAGR